MTLNLILAATALSALSGVPGLWDKRRSTRGEHVAASLVVLAGVLGIAGAIRGLRGTSSIMAVIPMDLLGAPAAVGLDPLSAFFLIPIFGVGALGSVYGLGYWAQREHVANGRKLRLFWGLLIAGMAVLVLARTAQVFLLGWETMALSAYFLITTDDDDPEVRRAGWIYLIATHLGALCLFAVFGLLRAATGSFELTALSPGDAGPVLMSVLFFLAVAGFGLKAGIMPLHFWLPAAHANAPSHVSAILSGVMIKMGIYGLLRISSLLPDPPIAWGAAVLLLGVGSGVAGVLFAIGQHDLKRLLAYHSVENIGIILIGLGLALVGRAEGRGDWVALGLAGCLLHVWNHGLFKPLLFLSAGSVVHATHTRQIDRLGGLAKRMPWTAALFFTGAVAICGLPPLNGFISEFLIYLGLFRSVGHQGGASWLVAAIAAPALALIGALALACFVKVYGAVFLGEARSAAATGAREAPRSMIVPMVVLAGCCALIGLLPLAAAPSLDRAVAAWAVAAWAGSAWAGSAGDELPSIARIAPLAALSTCGLTLLALVALAGVWLRRAMAARRVDREGTWSCGYAQPTPRMQYTASSFAQNLVEIFRWLLRPRAHRPKCDGLFCAPSRFESHVDDLALDGVLLPFARAARIFLKRLRGLQRGLTQQYVLYILLTVLVLLFTTLPLGQLAARLFAR